MLGTVVATKQLVQFEGLRTDRPHVVILGAGASLAAFPDGDANGRKLPLMGNLVEVLDLEALLKEANCKPGGDFEGLYSRLHSKEPTAPELAQIEQRVASYFDSLELPRDPTLYDLLLLTLREKDAVFTFNWDPFLVDAWRRLQDEAPLPQIFHLHGNVRVAYCNACRRAMRKVGVCPACKLELAPSRLLYPITNKDYAADGFVRTQWEAVQYYIQRADLITIFGYRCPETDREAMSIFRKAWKVDDPETRPFHRVEVIDVRDREELASQWSPFAHFPDHLDIRDSFFKSRLALCPRRTCEALRHSGLHGRFVEPLRNTTSFNVSMLKELVAAEMTRS